MGVLLSVNVARPRTAEYSDTGTTGIDKRPTTGPVAIAAPGPASGGRPGSGVAGDSIYFEYHGGDHQAVYSYAREDLDYWEKELGRELRGGMFGENITTEGLDVSGALIGERWRVGTDVVLEVTSPRVPCRTFAGWLDEEHWIKRFTIAARPGAYLRVTAPGEIKAGDTVTVESKPDHDVSVALMFRATTRERELLPRLRPALDVMNPHFADDIREKLAASPGARSARD
jgi:MOSC domain-containing protein YiiM